MATNADRWKDLCKRTRADLLTTVVTQEYLSVIVRSTKSTDKRLKLIAAVTACAPVVAIAVDLLGLLKIESRELFAALPPLFAVVLPVLNHSEKIDSLSSLHGKYVALLIEFERLFNSLKHDNNKTFLAVASTNLDHLSGQLRDLKNEMLSVPTKAAIMDEIENKDRSENYPEFWQTEERKESSAGSGRSEINFNTGGDF